MAKHVVTFTLPEREIKRADIKFNVKSDGAKLGSLEVSNGGLEWTPRNQRDSIHISWEDFDNWVAH